MCGTPGSLNPCHLRARFMNLGHNCATYHLTLYRIDRRRFFLHTPGTGPGLPVPFAWRENTLDSKYPRCKQSKYKRRSSLLSLIFTSIKTLIIIANQNQNNKSNAKTKTKSPKCTSSQPSQASPSSLPPLRHLRLATHLYVPFPSSSLLTHHRTRY